MREIRSLTSLRGLAALYVALLHFSAVAQTHCSVEIPALAPRGQLAVDFFFDLSGFVMGYNYYQLFQAKGVAAAMPEFLMKRVARIMPLHLFVLSLLVLYTLAVAPSFSGGLVPAITSAHPVREIAANALLLHGLGLAPNFNGPSWSISTEFLAYLVFPLFLAIAFNRSWAIRLGGILLAVFGLVAICYDQPHFNLGQLATGKALTRCFAGFMLGLAAYRWYARRGAAEALGADWIMIGLAGATAAIMVFRLGDIFAALLFPFIIVASSYNNGIAARVLGCRPLYFLGLISYSIYLTHAALAHLELQALQYFHPAPVGPITALSFAALGAASAIPLAWLTYRAIERPGRSLVRGLAARFSSSASPGPAAETAGP